MVKDIKGVSVIVGSKVKVLNIDPSIWEYLPDEEKNDLQSMIGEVLGVYEVSDDSVSVEKCWDDGKGRSHCHRLSLMPFEIELVV